jgi:hypothetical protein
VLQTAAMLASILGASVLITSVAMLLQKVETVSHPVLFVVFGNTMLAGWRALRAPPFSAREVGALAGCFALLVVLFGVYRRASRVAVPIVTLGRFDFATGKLASRPTVLRLETVVDSGHYIVAFLVVAFTEQWLAHFGTGLLGAMTNVGWPGLWKLGLYLAVAYYLVCSSAIKRLPVSNIKEFLERRSSFVAGAENWQLASRQLRHRIRLTLLANVLMESLIVGLAAGICHRFGLRAGWLFWTTTLALAASFLVRAIVDRSPGTASLGLVLQAPEEEAEDNRSMARRILRLGRGPLAVLVFVVMATTVLYAVLNDPQWLQGALRWLASPPVLVAALLTIGGFLSLLDYVIKGAARLRGGDPRRTKL